MKKDSLKVGLGSVLDWYDFALYTYFISVFNSNFFNLENGSSVFSILAWCSAFVARPFGSVFFGYIGDRFGRIVAFRLSSVLMFIPVILMPALPTYHEVGVIAPYCLIILRIIQGLCIGGEFAGSIVYIIEANENRRYFNGSLGSCTGTLGILLATLTAYTTFKFFDTAAIHAYIWRWVFASQILFVSFNLYLRLKAKENKAYLDAKQQIQHKKEYFNLIKQNKKLLLYGMGLIILHASSFFISFMYFPIYLKDRFGVLESSYLPFLSLLMLIRLIFIPFIGLIADKYLIATKIYKLSCILFMIVPFLILIALTRENYLLIYIIGFLTVLNSGTIPGLLSKFIPINIRYIFMSLIYNVSFGFASGVIPIVLQGFSDLNLKIAISVIFIIVSTISFIIIVGISKNAVSQA